MNCIHNVDGLYRPIQHFSVYDLDAKSMIELYYELGKVLNEVIDVTNDIKKNNLVCRFDCVTGDLEIKTVAELNSLQDDHMYWGCYY